MQVLSLFDGMSCGMIAMLSAGVEVDRYVAYEIDKYAVKTSQHNFPMVEQMGDVFKADFTQYQGFDFLVGGSPCTYWSIAQKNNRETEASGLGWELFSQYVRALRESKPRYFIYENNKSMAKAIRDNIRETFGFEEICINSALVSAQNRQRYYWVGKYNPKTGWYDKVPVEQPEDRGILLKDVLGIIYPNEPVCDKPILIGAVPENNGEYLNGGEVSQQYRVYSPGAKSVCLDSDKRKWVPEPVRIPEYASDKSRPVDAHYACLESGTWYNRVFNPNPAKQQHDYVAELLNPTIDGKARTLIHGYDKQGVENICGFVGFGSSGVAGRVRLNSSGEWKQKLEVRYAGTLQYAAPCEWDENSIPAKAVSGADGKVYTVCCVSDGQIAIKGKTYPIKLVDGYYIIRKLTVRECMRLQTVPEWYDFSCVSNTQAYKMLGNGWTCEVIAHLIRACLKGAD